MDSTTNYDIPFGPSNPLKPSGEKLKNLRWGCLGIFIVFGIVWSGCRATSYLKWSDGAREGRLIKFSSKGFPVKHYEGDLNTGALGRNNTGINDSMIWHFSVNDAAIAKELKDALGQDLVLEYNQYWNKGLWNDTEYLVTKIKRPQQDKR